MRRRRVEEETFRGLRVKRKEEEKEGRRGLTMHVSFLLVLDEGVAARLLRLLVVDHVDLKRKRILSFGNIDRTNVNFD